MNALDKTIKKVNSGLAMFYLEDLKDESLKAKFKERLREEMAYQRMMLSKFGTTMANNSFKRLPKITQLAIGHQAMLGTLETIEKLIE